MKLLEGSYKPYQMAATSNDPEWIHFNWEWTLNI